MKKTVFAAAVAALLSTATIASAAEATGTIQSIDTANKMVTLDNGQTFQLGSSVDTAMLKTGQKVNITYSGSGTNMTATSVKPAS